MQVESRLSGVAPLARGPGVDVPGPRHLALPPATVKVVHLRTRVRRTPQVRAKISCRSAARSHKTLRLTAEHNDDGEKHGWSEHARDQLRETVQVNTPALRGLRDTAGFSLSGSCERDASSWLFLSDTNDGGVLAALFFVWFRNTARWGLFWYWFRSSTRGSSVRAADAGET